MYRIVTVCFDHEGNELAPAGILLIYNTGCPFPTFGFVKPAVTNTHVDMSPYGQRVFLSDVLFDREQDGNKNVTIPFGKQDCKLPQDGMKRTRSGSSRRRCASTGGSRRSA